MGYNVTPREDGSFHVEPDNSGCGIFIFLAMIAIAVGVSMAEHPILAMVILTISFIYPLIKKLKK